MEMPIANIMSSTRGLEPGWPQTKEASQLIKWLFILVTLSPFLPSLVPSWPRVKICKMNIQIWKRPPQCSTGCYENTQASNLMVTRWAREGILKPIEPRIWRVWKEGSDWATWKLKKSLCCTEKVWRKKGLGGQLRGHSNKAGNDILG